MDQGTLSIFAAIVTSIVVEAAPFLLLGSLLASILAVFVGDGALEKIGQRSLPVQISLGLFAGLLLPTCECGIVPVTRRLLKKGVPAGAALPFMLAAPVVNPVSIASTYVAFQGDLSMVLLRVAFVLVPAATIGWVMGGVKGPDLLRPTLEMAHANGCGCGCGEEHNHEATRRSFLSKIIDVLRHTAHEFLDMGRFLILGACAAGLFKVFVPQGLLSMVSGNLVLAVAAMMLMAVLLTVCSEADAFVAASLSMFPRPALLAFLALGPMLDLKLIPSFLSAFQRRVAVAVMIVPVLMIFILAVSLGLVWGHV
jgi:hypothetical protein